MALPARRVESTELDARLGFAPGKLNDACGVASRFVCEGESQDDLAVAAALAALADAGMDAEAIDLVISASAVAKQPIPSTAPLIVGRLGIRSGNCTAFDINSACLSFVSAFDVATNLLASDRFRAVLVVSSEIASRALPWSTAPDTAGLFGDGAAAVVLKPAGDRPGIVKAAYFETYPEGYDLCQLAAGGTGIDFQADPEAFKAASLFRMDGHKLFKLAARYFPDFVARLLARAGWAHEEVDLVVPHQASRLALTHLVQRCGFVKGQVVDIVEEYGNQVAASIPTAFHLARKAGRVPAGSRVLLLGTSAGVSFGGMAIEI
jgi:3-oxoacyl-[acyl-carrier-protein] synthase-3